MAAAQGGCLQAARSYQTRPEPTDRAHASHLRLLGAGKRRGLLTIANARQPPEKRVQTDWGLSCSASTACCALVYSLSESVPVTRLSRAGPCERAMRALQRSRAPATTLSS